MNEHNSVGVERCVTVCLITDVLAFGGDGQEHDVRLKAVLQQLALVGVTLNPSKCEFSRSLLKFLGHVVNKSGILVDPEK